MAQSYRSFRFFAVDNIMDHSYFATVLTQLVEERSDFELFYEIKANLRRAHVKLLRDAGVKRVQPGIESLQLERSQTDAERHIRRAERQLAALGALLWRRRRVELALGLSRGDAGRL